MLIPLARSEGDVESALSNLQYKLREMEQVKEELQCAKGEIQLFHEKFANYEYDIRRYKQDINKACGEVEYLRQILKANDISTETYAMMSKTSTSDNDKSTISEGTKAISLSDKDGGAT